MKNLFKLSGMGRPYKFFLSH